jgi:hypothetical protein
MNKMNKMNKMTSSIDTDSDSDNTCCNCYESYLHCECNTYFLHEEENEECNFIENEELINDNFDDEELCENYLEEIVSKKIPTKPNIIQKIKCKVNNDISDMNISSKLTWLQNTTTITTEIQIFSKDEYPSLQSSICKIKKCENVKKNVCDKKNLYKKPNFDYFIKKNRLHLRFATKNKICIYGLRCYEANYKHVMCKRNIEMKDQKVVYKNECNMKTCSFAHTWQELKEELEKRNLFCKFNDSCNKICIKYFTIKRNNKMYKVRKYYNNSDRICRMLHPCEQINNYIYRMNTKTNVNT